VVIRTPPQNQTVAVGDTVSLTCGIDRSYDGAFLWITYVGSTMKNILFCGTMSTCRPSSDFPSDKYMTVASQKNDTPDSFTLNISKADLMDGARYTCSFLPSGLTGDATVVVIGKRGTSYKLTVERGILHVQN
jgi:Immunoglobulin I-set domain